MKRVKMHEAKSSLSALVREVRTGIEPDVTICVAGRAAARLVPIAPAPKRTLGVDRGLISIAPDFDAVNADIARLFEGI